MAYSGVLLTTIVYISCAIGHEFPWKDIFNHSSDLEAIKGNYLCSSKSRYQSNKCCECTKECLKYKTCCIDILWDVERPVRSKEYLDLLINVTSIYKDTSCEPIFPVTIQNKLNQTSENILMVSECLNHASHIDKERCKKPSRASFDSIMPVFGSDQYIYKNAFCARCNFIKHFLFVNLTAKCEVNKRHDKKLHQRLVNCSFKVTRTDTMKNHIKTCIRNIFDQLATCNRTNKYYKICSSYLGVIRNKKNYHCLLCNGTITNNVSKTLPKFLCPKYAQQKSVTEDKNQNQNLFQFLLSINFSEQTNITIRGIKHSSKYFCSKGEVYNIISSKYKEFSCLKGYKKSGNGCFKDQGLMKSTRTAHSNNFDRCLTRSKISMIVSMYPFEKNETSSVQVLKMIFKIALSGPRIDLGTTYNNSHVSLNITQNQLKLILNALTSMESPIWIAVDRVYLTSLLSEMFKKVALIDFMKDFKDGNLCAEAKAIKKIPIDLTQNCSFVLNNKIFNMSITNLLVEIDRLAWKRKLMICSEFYLRSNCALKAATNYTLFESKTLKVGNILYSTHYMPFNGSFGICIPKNNMTYHFFSPYKWFYYVLKASKYIYISGLIVSIVCYSIIIVIYRFNKVVKRSSSATVVLQCVTLLVTDTTVIVAFHMRNHVFACKLIGIFLHWGLLASQLWTLIISFDLLLKVRSVSKGIIKGNTVRIAKYCVIAYLIPTVIVSTTVLLDMYQIINMGYGWSYIICTFSDYHSNLYFVITPYATIFLITILFLIHSLYCLWKRERKARRVLQNSGRHNYNLLSIAFKLTFALGLAEFIGFLQIYKKDLTESDMIFNSISLVLVVTLRSLRGLWLFLIFGCSLKNIINLLRPIWMKKSKT